MITRIAFSMLATFLLALDSSSAAARPAAQVKWRFIGPGAGGSMFGAAFCPTDPRIIIFDGDMGALYWTGDGGRTWDDLCIDYGPLFDPNALSTAASRLPPNRYTHAAKTRGVQNIACDQIAIDPFDPKTYYAAYMDLGLEVSRDGGTYWEPGCRMDWMSRHVQHRGRTRTVSPLQIPPLHPGSGFISDRPRQHACSG